MKSISLYSNTLTALFCLSLAMTTSLYAAENSDHHHEHEKHEKHDEKHEKHEKHEKTDASTERVQHGSHEHGEARLTVAKTDVGMEISLETPAANLFGFEHQANDKEEHKAVQATKEKLNAGETLFIANKAAKCTLKDVDIDSTMLSSDEKDKKEKKQASHEHEHKHEHDKHKAEHHDEKKEAHETHSDVDVTWLFSCEKPKALESVATTLFSQFPKGFEHLNVEWITSNGAGTVKLEADGSVKFK